MGSYEIFANHAHIFQKQVREDGTMEALLRVMDSCGISRAVAFAPFHKYFDDSCCANPNRWLAKTIHGNSRLYGFGVIDFARDDLADQVHEAKQLGLRGLKLHPAFQKFKIDSDAAFQVYEAAQKEGLPISFHTGIHWHRIRDYNMLLFDEVAYHFPELRFSMEHVGGYSFFLDGVAVLRNNRENVYAGLTSVFDRGKNKYWYLNDQQVKDLLWITGCERSIFGLDFPYNGAEEIAAAIEKVRSLGLTETEEAFIMGENLERFLA